MAEAKTRSDFSTDSEWYTYVVTHPEFFKKDEEENNREEYQKGIFVCEKCGYIIDETSKDFETKENKNIKRDENSNILNCPKCKAREKEFEKDF